MSQEYSNRRPYRLIVFASKTRPRVVRRNKRSTTIRFETSQYGYMGWQETQHYQEARLPSAGSFLFAGLHDVRRAAMDYLALPTTQSISIRTNQDRKVYRFIKQHDGSITGYYQLNDANEQF